MFVVFGLCAILIWGNRGMGEGFFSRRNRGNLQVALLFCFQYIPTSLHRARVYCCSMRIIFWLEVLSTNVRPRRVRSPPLSPCDMECQTWTRHKRKQLYWMRFYSKILLPHRRSSSLTMKLYPVGALSNISVYISLLIWLGLLTSPLSSQNA